MVLGNLLAIGGCVDRSPAGLIEAWKQRAAVNTLAKNRQAGIVRDVVAFFSQRGSRVMLLKGVALDAVVYDNLWRTQSGDADLLVDTPFDALTTDDAARLGDLIRGHGVELNFRRHHDVDMNGVLFVDYARMWSDARAISYRGEPAFVPSPEDMLLTACINLCRKRYRSLKGMVAVHDVIRAFPTLDWDTLLRSAQACGATRILYASLTLIAEGLGSDTLSGVSSHVQVGPPRRALIRFLCRALGRWCIQVPMRAHESLSERLASELLRVATYRRGHFLREIQAHRDLRRYRATAPTDVLGS